MRTVRQFQKKCLRVAFT